MNKILIIAMLLAPVATQANVEITENVKIPELVSTQSLITSIAKSNLSEAEKNILIESYVQSRTQNSSQIMLTGGHYQHQSNYHNSERRSYCNGARRHNNHW